MSARRRSRLEVDDLVDGAHPARLDAAHDLVAPVEKAPRVERDRRRRVHAAIPRVKAVVRHRRGANRSKPKPSLKVAPLSSVRSAAAQDPKLLIFRRHGTCWRQRRIGKVTPSRPSHEGTSEAAQEMCRSRGISSDGGTPSPNVGVRLSERKPFGATLREIDGGNGQACKTLGFDTTTCVP